jgi:tetratricopeptide (TPR) repeat protein
MTLEEMERDHPPPSAFEQYVKGLLAQVPATRMSYLTHAMRLDPAFERPRLALWGVYHDQGEHAEALAVVDRVPEDHRLFRRSQFLSAVSLMHLERYEDAFETLTRLAREWPDPALYNNLGIVQLRRAPDAPGGPAVSYFGDALRLDGSDSDLMFNLGYAYFLARQFPPAISWLTEALRRDPADGQAHYVLGAALQASGSAPQGAREQDLARRLSSELAEFDATNAAGGVPHGLERMKTDIDVPASLRVEHAIAEAGQRDQREAAAFQLDAGRRLFNSGRDVEATAALQRAVYLDPYGSDAHLLLGRLYLRAGRTAEAIDALKISIWSADTVGAHLVLAEAYVAAADPDAARAELQIVLTRDPDNSEARRLLDAL